MCRRSFFSCQYYPPPHNGPLCLCLGTSGKTGRRAAEKSICQPIRKRQKSYEDAFFSELEDATLRVKAGPPRLGNEKYRFQNILKEVTMRLVRLVRPDNGEPMEGFNWQTMTNEDRRRNAGDGGHLAHGVDEHKLVIRRSWQGWASRQLSATRGRIKTLRSTPGLDAPFQLVSQQPCSHRAGEIHLVQDISAADMNPQS